MGSSVSSTLEGSLSDCARLVELHAAAVTADRHVGQETTRATVEASLAAHKELTDACETFRRRCYPRAGRVVAVFGEVFTVSPAGRRIVCVYSERDRLEGSHSTS